MTEQTPLTEWSGPLRRQVYVLLIVMAVAMTVARIVAFVSPTMSDNDRSRWATIRVLVDQGTYVVGQRTEFGDGTFKDSGIVFDEKWQSIDRVLNPEPVWRDDHATGNQPKAIKRFFSSKPPLLATILAGEYWLLKHGCNLSMTQDAWLITRIILITLNAVPLLIYLLLLARLVDALGRTDWGRIVTVAFAGFGTFLTTFQVTLNNHTLATTGLMFAIYPILRPTLAGERVTAWRYFLAGVFTGWTVTNELPSLAFAAAYGALLLWRAPKATLLLFIPGVVLLFAALLGTNFLALVTWQPAYEKYGTIWYVYPGSPWEKPTGIDAGGDSWPVYLFHLTLGHHGFFSLTPVFFLGLIGMTQTLWRRLDQALVVRLLAATTLLVSVVVLGFYLTRTQNYNYGGWTSGPRWFFWLIPLWLLAAMPIVDQLAQRRWGRGLVLLLLAISAFSATYAFSNPWRHPWLYNLLDQAGWIRY